MKTCYRCGVDFDPTLFIPGSPCPDCQEDMEGVFFNYWTKDGIAAAKERDIRYLHSKGLTDGEIATELGLKHRSNVLVWRQKLGLPSNFDSTNAASYWRDYDGRIEYLRSDEHAQKIIEGQRKGSK